MRLDDHKDIYFMTCYQNWISKNQFDNFCRLTNLTKLCSNDEINGDNKVLVENSKKTGSFIK